MTRVSQSSQAKHGRVPDLILCIMPSKDTELYRFAWPAVCLHSMMVMP